MKNRNLKIAVSAVSLLACLLLGALWVRSYWIMDSVTWNGGRRIGVYSRHGQIRVSTSNITFAGAPLLKWHTTESMMPDGIGNWMFQSHREGMFVVVPHRLPIALFVLILIAAQPWSLAPSIRWRFSLRTLLIVITVIALVLGGLSLTH